MFIITFPMSEKGCKWLIKSNMLCIGCGLMMI